MTADSPTAALQEIAGLLEHIGFRSFEDSDGSTVWELPVAPHVVNLGGGIQGGLIATLADIAAGTAALAVRPPNGGRIVTADLNIRYLLPITSGTARAVTRILHSTKRTVVVEVEVLALPGNEMAAHVTASFVAVGT